MKKHKEFNTENLFPEIRKATTLNKKDGIEPSNWFELKSISGDINHSVKEIGMVPVR